jgi:DNA-binding beta-propeller fold protein YncE
VQQRLNGSQSLRDGQRTLFVKELLAMAERARVLCDDARPAPSWPLCSSTARLLWLRAVCAVAEGADVPLSHAAPDASAHCPPDVCVAAVLGDALHRVAVLGGREGMSRSLGSVYSGSVTRFLGRSLRGVASRVIYTPAVKSSFNGVAVSRDGCTLLVSDFTGGSHAIHEFDVVDGSLHRVVGSKGGGPLQFRTPCQVCIAPDDFVFVVDYGNNRVQVLTPTLDFHSFVGVGQLSGPVGVCANADVVVVSQFAAHRISVFNRRDGGLLRQFGSFGSSDGRLSSPCGLCFMSRDRRVAVVEQGNDRVSVFSIDGEFIRHVGVGVLKRPVGVACSAFDELVVADTDNRRVVVLSDVGDVLLSFGDGHFAGVAMIGSTVFAQDLKSRQCVVWS